MNDQTTKKIRCKKGIHVFIRIRELMMWKQTIADEGWFTAKKMLVIFLRNGEEFDAIS